MHILASRDQSRVAVKISDNLIRRRAKIFNINDEISRLPIPPNIRDLVDHWTQPVANAPGDVIFQTIMANQSAANETDDNFRDLDNLDQQLTLAQAGVNALTATADDFKFVRALHLSHPDWFLSAGRPGLPIAYDPERVVAYLTAGARRDDPGAGDSWQQPNREDNTTDIFPVYYVNQLNPLYTTAFRPTFAFEKNDKGTGDDSFGMLKCEVDEALNGERPFTVYSYDIEGDYSMSAADYNAGDTSIFTEVSYKFHYVQAASAKGDASRTREGQLAFKNYKSHDLSIANMGQNTLDWLNRAWFGDGLTVPLP